MRSFPEITDSITGNLADVLEEWGAAKHDEPWVTLPERPSLNNLPELVRFVAQVALVRPFNAEMRRNKVLAAASHGEHRRSEGWQEAQLFQEYTLLRRAIWRFIQQRHGSDDQSFQAIGQIDAALTLATVASLRGFHRDMFEQRGDWPQSLERLVNDWPLRD